MKTISTLFSGGEGVGVGARAAGLEHLWGIEYDNDIAQVARDNGFDTITADVLDIDPATLKRPDILHASPVCTNASIANVNGEEAQLDKDAATKTAQFIDVLQPEYFTLENVFPYRHFEAFKIITDALASAGYSYDYWHINSSDYGVPQTRKRLILIAKRGRGQHITMPPVTHHNPAGYEDNQMMMFEPDTLPWVGWYEAIEDLIPGLPDSEFAPWQLKRLSGEITQSWLIGSENAGQKWGGDLFANTPSMTITQNQKPRAFIASGALNNNSTSLTTRDGHHPMMTVTTSHNNRDIKAWYVGDQQGQVGQCERPAFTLRANESGGGMPKAFVTDLQNASRTYTIREQQEPFTTVLSSLYRRPSCEPKGVIGGRVVKMTPRALARFQSFPDDYKLPDSNSLAVRVIGNAVPPLLYKNIAGIFWPGDCGGF